jgi:hypothetical protein
VKFTAETTIDAPADAIDLDDWLFHLSDEEYQACARGHRGAGTFTERGVRGTVNVENVGGTLMIQHYHQVSAAPAKVDMLSTRSRAYIFHIVPVPIRVRWTMTATPRTADTTTFSCTVEAHMSPVLRFLAATIFVPYFLRKHVHEETPLFAADIARKLNAAGKGA